MRHALQLLLVGIELDDLGKDFLLHGTDIPGQLAELVPPLGWQGLQAEVLAEVGYRQADLVQRANHLSCKPQGQYQGDKAERGDDLNQALIECLGCLQNMFFGDR